MSLIDELEGMGAINSKDALARLMNKTALYEKVLKKLPKELKRADEFLPSLASGDENKAFEIAHTLKGVAGNLSVTPLYKTYSDISDKLRGAVSGGDTDPEGAKKLFEDILPLQEEIISCIEKNS